MNKYYMRIILSGSFLLLFHVAHAEIPLVQLKGLDTCMKADYQQLAPVYGALFWHSGLPKNLWLFGDEQSSMTTLIRHLFHVHVDGSFDKTRSPMYVNYYFTPADIGSLIGIIFKNKDDFQALEKRLQEFTRGIVQSRTSEIKQAIIDSLQKTQERLSELIKKAQETISNKLPENVRQSVIEFLNQRKTDKAAFKTEMKKLNLGKNLQKIIEQSLQVPLNAHAKNQKQLDDELKDSVVVNEFLLKDAGITPDVKPNFVQAILGALIEEKKSIFPEGTVNNFLLALLWKMGNSREDVKTYLEALAKEVQQPVQDVFVWQEVTQYDFDYYVRLTYVKAKYYSNYNEYYLAINDVITLNLADLIFARYGFDYYKNSLPPLVGMIGNAHYLNPNNNEIIEFPDCGETSLRNFINALIYDSDTHSFNPELLEKLSENPSTTLINYYKKYSTPELILTDQAHHDWAKVVSNLPGVLYRNEVCNIMSDTGMENMLAVINNLLPGIKSWQVLEERLQKNGFDISIIPKRPLDQEPIHNTLTISLTKPGKDPVVLTWAFVSGHFSVNFSFGQINYAEIYWEALLKRIKALPVNNITQRWPLIMVYGAFEGPDVSVMTIKSAMAYSAVLIPQAPTPEKSIDLAKKSLNALNNEPDATIKQYLGSLIRNVYKKLPNDDGILNKFFSATLNQQIPNDPDAINFFKNLLDIAKQQLSSAGTDRAKAHLIETILSIPIPSSSKAKDLITQITSKALETLGELKNDEVKADFLFLIGKREIDKIPQQIVQASAELMASIKDNKFKVDAISSIISMDIISDKVDQELIKPLFQAAANSMQTLEDDETKKDVIRQIIMGSIPSDKTAQQIVQPIFQASADLMASLKDNKSKSSTIIYIIKKDVPSDEGAQALIKPLFQAAANSMQTLEIDESNIDIIYYLTRSEVPLNKQAQEIIKPLFESAAKLLISIKDPAQRKRATETVRSMQVPSDPGALEIVNILRKASEQVQ